MVEIALDLKVLGRNFGAGECLGSLHFVFTSVAVEY